MTCCINKTNATPVDEETATAPNEFEIVTFPVMINQICRTCEYFVVCADMHYRGIDIPCTAIVSVPSGYVRKDKNR